MRTGIAYRRRCADYCVQFVAQAHSKRIDAKTGTIFFVPVFCCHATVFIFRQLCLGTFLLVFLKSCIDKYAIV